MEKQDLPNSTLILILGILSIVTCCCLGIPGVILGIVTLVLAKNAKETYMADPPLYSGYENVKTGKILAIVAIVLSTLTVLYIIVMIAFFGGADNYGELWEEALRTNQ